MSLQSLRRERKPYTPSLRQDLKPWERQLLLVKHSSSRETLQPALLSAERTRITVMKGILSGVAECSLQQYLGNDIKEMRNKIKIVWRKTNLSKRNGNTKAVRQTFCLL